MKSILNMISSGLLIWKKQRLHWNGDRIKEKKKRFAQNIDIEEILDHILSNSWQQRPPSPTSRSTSGSSKENTKQRMRSSLSDPVPLRQIVDVLVDLWEAEGHDM